MSWLSSALNYHIPIIGESVGGLVGAATGNPGLMVAGEAARGGDIKQNITGDVLQGAKNTPLAIAGVNALGSSGGGDAAPGGTAGTAGGDVPGGAVPGSPGWIDALKGVVSAGGDVLGWLQKNSGGLLEAANVANSAYRQAQADKYAGKAYDTANDSYNQRAPLRTAGIAGLLNPSANTPDLSTLKSIAGPNSGNPFAPRGLPVAGVPGTPTPTVNGAPPGPVYMPGGSQTAPRPLPIAPPPSMAGVGQIPRLPVATS